MEADFSFPEIIAAYNDGIILLFCSVCHVSHAVSTGTHPYFVYQESVLALSDDDGEEFYASMLDIIRHFECKYPHAVMSKTSLPRYVSLLSNSTRHYKPDRLPLEILERVLLLCAHKE